MTMTAQVSSLSTTSRLLRIACAALPHMQAQLRVLLPSRPRHELTRDTGAHLLGFRTTACLLALIALLLSNIGRKHGPVDNNSGGRRADIDGRE